MQFSFIAFDSESKKLISHTIEFTVQSGPRKRQRAEVDFTQTSQSNSISETKNITKNIPTYC